METHLLSLYCRLLCVWSHTPSAFIGWQHFGKELRLQSTATSTTLEPLTLSWPLEKNNLGHTFWDWAKRTPKKIHLVGQVCYSTPQPVFIVEELAYLIGSEGKWACEALLLNCKPSSTHYWQFVMLLQWLSLFYFLCPVFALLLITALYWLQQKNNLYCLLMTRFWWKRSLSHLSCCRWLLRVHLSNPKMNVCDAEFGLFIYPFIDSKLMKSPMPNAETEQLLISLWLKWWSVLPCCLHWTWPQRLE